MTSYDRHCFHTQVPELGIFIIASPLGRAAIFSLTKVRQPGVNNKSNHEYKYSFRQEYILPFGKDEENKILSLAETVARLVGVAVGPVQGAFNQPGERHRSSEDLSGLREKKWRLLMYYTDHTVLSFELSRRRDGREPGVSDLVI